MSEHRFNDVFDRQDLSNDFSEWDESGDVHNWHQYQHVRFVSPEIKYETYIHHDLTFGWSDINKIESGSGIIVLEYLDRQEWGTEHYYDILLVHDGIIVKEVMLK